jgi:hypothetical protein
MARFETPEPITGVIEVVVGDVRIVAGERSDTVVEVRPRDGSKRDDVAAAELTRVECEDGRLLVKAPRRRRSWSPFSDGGAIEVEVELPAGSHLTAETGMGALVCGGPVGQCRLKSGFGDIRIEQAATLTATTGAGDVGVERVSGDAELSTGSGEVRAGTIGGSAAIKNSNGDTRVRDVAGDVRVRAANGDVAIERSRASVAAKTANGGIRLGAVERGPVVAETGYGAVEIAIVEGPAVWLDLTTGYGRLHNTLGAAAPPAPGEDRVEVRARSGFGDITIRRAERPGAASIERVEAT